MDDLLNLQQRFNECLFRIPDYQRGYSWENEQLEEFWSDLTSLIDGQDHYTGMLSLKKVSNKEIESKIEKWNDEIWLVNSGYSIYELVDGQQRLTTMIILINEILSICRKNNIYSLNDISIDELSEKYLYKTKSTGVFKTYKFGYEVDNPSDKYFRKEILGDSNVGTASETFYTLNLLNAKEFFNKKLNERINNKENKQAEIEKIFNKLTLHFKFNMYYINNDFNVYVAFETMNNRGKALSHLELLKNRLIYLSTLFDVEEDTKNNVRENINETWKDIYSYLGKNKNNPLDDDEFLRDHWMIYFGYQTRQVGRNQTIPYQKYLLNKYFIQQNIDPNNLYVPEFTFITTNEDEYEEESENEENNEIESTKNNQSILLKIEDIQKYVNSLKELIPFWYEMKCPTRDENSDISKYLIRLNILGHINARPLITVLLSRKDISYSDKVQCLKNIERFNFLHYRLNNYNPTWQNSLFYNLGRDLYKHTIDIEDVLETTRAVDYLSKNNVVIAPGVIDKFNRLFKRDGFYTWKSLKYILYIYDLSQCQTLSEQQLNPNDYFKQDPRDSYSVEHIYPQKATEEYWIKRFREYNGKQLDDKNRKALSSSLGNLLPLSKRVNSRLQNISFDEKKERYAKGSKSEIEVSREKEWTPEAILKRGLDIVDFMQREFEFIFANKAEKIKFLGLDFMTSDKDYNIDVVIPEILETNNKKDREIVFKEKQFIDLISNSNQEVINLYKELDPYIMGLGTDVKKATTSIYIPYTNGKNFVEIYFQKNNLKLILMHGDYNDPLNKVKKLNDSYNWTNDNFMFIGNKEELEYAKGIIKQSYEKTK
ncbi:MAG: DUF262 domain-containing protein [Clostridia bacterium]|nr:DUF262 domain-containing protein [Clostridia bacterium]